MKQLADPLRDGATLTLEATVARPRPPWLTNYAIVDDDL